MIVIATYFVQKVFRKLLVTIPLILYGLALVGVGIFTADRAPWHGIFALVVFIAGGPPVQSCCQLSATPIGTNRPFASRPAVILTAA